MNEYQRGYQAAMDWVEREKVQRLDALVDRLTDPKDLGDMVKAPPHYTWLKDLAGVEVRDITRHLNYNMGNVVKYVLRHQYKGGVQDLQKARECLEDEIRRLGDHLLHSEPFG